MDKEISLLEALTGVDFTVIHLDGRIIRIQNEKGQVIKPGSVMTCEGLGMPFHKTPYKYGNLFINFKIIFPDSMDQGEMTSMQTTLKSQAKSSDEQTEIDAVADHVELEAFQESHKNTHAQGGTKADHSDEEEEDGE